MGASNTPSSEDLRKASRHLTYEVNMLNASAEMLGRFTNPQERFAALESFTVHARALLQFFYPPDLRAEGESDKIVVPRHDDDLFATHYVPNWEDVRREPRASALNKVAWRVGKEIAHITRGRLEAPGPDARVWPIGEIRLALNELMTTFRDQSSEYDSRGLVIPPHGELLAQRGLTAGTTAEPQVTVILPP